MTPPLVRLVGASRRFRRGAETVTAVDDVSVDLVPGELTVFSGPSGSGKTTLLNLLLGWERPDIGLREPTTTEPNWSQLAVVPQRLGLIAHCTILENVALPGRVARLEMQPDDAMSRLGIAHLADRFPAETSLGEQQRTAVARAVVTSPRLLIADEPTSHQDEQNTHRIGQLLADAAARGAAVAVATHDRRIAERATSSYEIRDGRLRTVAGERSAREAHR